MRKMKNILKNLLLILSIYEDVMVRIYPMIATISPAHDIPKSVRSIQFIMHLHLPLRDSAA